MAIYTRQKGAALIVFFLALIITGSIFVLTTISTDLDHVNSQKHTRNSLNQAKEALLAYAVSYYMRASAGGNQHAGIHGLLPCPEEPSSTADGVDSGNCATTHTSSLGRLPWRTLDMPPLKDGSGECLWYAVSGGFFNNPRSPMTNDDTPGMFQLFNYDGALIAGNLPENRIAAVIIAPGAPLNTQSRSNTDPARRETCKVAYNVVASTDYLDRLHGINNALVDTANPDQLEQFITATGLTKNDDINDQIITITTDEIFDAIKKNSSLYDDKIGQLGIQLGNCLIDYALSSATSGCTTLPGCYANCDNDFAICDAAATTGKEHANCIKTRNKCYKDCRKACKSGGKGKGKGGGGGSTNYRLPWPAPINLNADYRLDNSYDDLAGAAQGYFGRLPYLTGDSSAQIGIPDAHIFETCGIDTLVPAEMYTLWRHWKDHWFYVVGEEFSPTGTNSAPCTNCPQLNGGARYSAILIFSDERINNQLRRSNETENPNPVLNDSKANLDNYLEGSNFNNHQDGSGNKDYGLANENDRLFCISEDFSTVTECTP